MSQAHADRNLLLGILAFQNAFVSRESLLSGMQTWLLEKNTPLGDILQKQGALDPNCRGMLEALVAQHLKQHDNNPHRSLLAFSTLASVRERLEALPDQHLQASLAKLAASTRSADPPATPSPSLGEQTSGGTRFRIVRPHAKGGLGVVHVAVDNELNREVALKEIQDRYADQPESRSRFLREAEITGGLEHPGIVPVYGLGAYSDGRPFYAMRFVRGESLMEAITHFHQAEASVAMSGGNDASRNLGDVYSGVEFHKLLRRLIDVCNAMQYAHDRGVVHRDLKPGNVMLGRYGETLVVDWGLAKAHESDRPLLVESTATPREPPLRPLSGIGNPETLAGSAIGTPAYMSPEQAAGRVDRIGPASDVYSLGATLYCLLTGRPPLQGPVEEMLGKAQRGEIAPPRRHVPSVPPALEAICLKAMALKSEDRYPSPRTFVEDLEHWLANEPVAAWPEPWRVKVRRWVGKHQTMVSSAAATILVATLGLTVATILLGAANEAERQARIQADIERKQALVDRRRAEDNERLANIEKRLKAEQLQRAELLLYDSTFREANLYMEQNDFVSARERLDDCRADLRGPEHGFVTTYCERRVRPLFEHRDQVMSLALSADGKRLFSCSKDQTIKIWDVEAGKELRTLRGHNKWVTSLALFSDGKRLVSGSSDATIKVWDLETGNESLVLRGHKYSVTCVLLSPDGKRLYSGGGDQTIKVWDMETHKELKTLRHFLPVRTLALSADGKRLFATSQAPSITVWDLESGKELPSLRGHNTYVVSLLWSSDGTRLLSGGGDATIRVWDWAAGKEIQSLRGHTASVIALAWSADGKKLVSGSSDSSIKVWDLQSGTVLQSLRGHGIGVQSLVLSEDGKQMYSAGEGESAVKAWDLEASKEMLTLRGHRQAVSNLLLSSDGKRLFSAAGDQTIKIWDLDTYKEMMTLRGHKANVTSLLKSADDKRLYSAGGAGDDSIRVWNVETGQEMVTLRGHANVRCLALSPSGTRLYSGSYERTIKVWDLEAAKELLTLRGHVQPVTSLVLSDNGQKLYSASGQSLQPPQIKVWDLEKGTEIATLNGHKASITRLVLSSNGKWLYSCGFDKTIIMWNLETGKEMQALRGHQSAVTSLALSSNGKRLFSGSFDQTIKIWNLEAGKEMLTLRGHTSWINSLLLSPDGKRLFSAGDIKVWDLGDTQRGNDAGVAQ